MRAKVKEFLSFRRKNTKKTEKTPLFSKKSLTFLLKCVYYTHMNLLTTHTVLMDFFWNRSLATLLSKEKPRKQQRAFYVVNSFVCSQFQNLQVSSWQTPNTNLRSNLTSRMHQHTVLATEALVAGSRICITQGNTGARRHRLYCREIYILRAG